MKSLFKSALMGAVLLLMASCGSDSIYSDFKKMDNGAYMMFYSRGDSDVMPRLKDEVTIEMAQYFNDSLLLTTAGDEPMTIVLREADFVGDVTDGLLMMHVGDSARLVVSADSVFINLMGIEEIPEEFAGQPIYYDLKLLSVKPFEVLEAERKVMLDSLRQVEETYLTALCDDPNNTVTESGLIVVEKTGKGKLAKMGDYVDFDFLMLDMDGDTIMNSFGVEPVEIQYGEEFICKGINEAIGMVPEGGSMHFVVPSPLAFDSTGYEHFIQPYAPMVVDIHMNRVMDKADYDKLMAERAAETEAERARLLEQEAKAIEAYVTANNITDTPSESGIYLFPTKEGEGELAKWGDDVAVHYVLRNLQGEQIESSYEYGEPMVFKIGSGEMIPAVEEAVMTLSQGAKVTVLTPSSQAFGEFDLGEMLPPFTPLLIDLELVEIK